MKYPKVLVVSNNPLSETRNNGKTMASFFEGFPEKRLAQLYFSNDVPDSDICRRYFQLSDRDIFRSLIRLTPQCGRVATTTSHDETKSVRTFGHSRLSRALKSNSGRLAREVVWAISPCPNVKLIEWLDETSPDVIFFTAGDSAFAYDIVNMIKRRYGADLVTFITDDYVLPRRRVSVAWWVRRSLVLRKMRRAIAESRSLITISEKMRSEYARLFGRDSFVAFNIPSHQSSGKEASSDKEYIELVYAGGLHFSRWKTLRRLAKVIEHYNANRTHGKPAYLKIYTNEVPEAKMRSRIEVSGAAGYRGSLTKEQLEAVLPDADILVHAESFDRSCIESTRLSVSTKISEYLALGRPILAVGPAEVASMEFLEDAACCVTSVGKIEPMVHQLLEGETHREWYASKAEEKWRTVRAQYSDAEALQKRLFGME